jgi:hypothetical protein
MVATAWRVNTCSATLTCSSTSTAQRDTAWQGLVPGTAPGIAHHYAHHSAQLCCCATQQNVPFCTHPTDVLIGGSAASPLLLLADCLRPQTPAATAAYILKQRQGV